MASDQWVSWRSGRNFKSWHAKDTALTVMCGMQIPPKAATCFAADEFVAALPESEVCKNCRKLRGLKRVPLVELFR